jgi:Zn-dependent protease
MYNFQFDKKILYIILGIMVLSMLASYLTDTSKLLALVLTIPGVLIAITFHEFAHAFAADKLGDDTPRRQGRLSLNPFAHLDPVGSILLLFAGFGWGKPVEVNPRNYNRDMSMEKADAIVSIAGPVMNFLLALVFTLIYCAVYKFAYFEIATNTVFSLIMSAVYYTIYINIGLGVFNLIPLPPLDGSKVIMPFLPYKAKQWFQDNTMVFYIIFLAIWIFGIAGTIISPIINAISSGLLHLGALIFGLSI